MKFAMPSSLRIVGGAFFITGGTFIGGDVFTGRALRGTPSWKVAVFGGGALTGSPTASTFPLFAQTRTQMSLRTENCERKEDAASSYQHLCAPRTARLAR